MIEKDSAFQSSASTQTHELEKFERMAEAWWAPDGDFKPLHILNPTRVAYVKKAIAGHFSKDTCSEQPLSGISVLDVGCGGGLLAEPLCRLGADVTGVDAVDKNIEVAQLHAGQMDLNISYLATTVEQLGEEGQTFDVVTALEIVEHVADPQAFLTACLRVLKPNGILLVSTLNRTLKSYALGIVAAEYILGWLPKGTHDWEKFVKPHELQRWIEKAGKNVDMPLFEVTDTTGMSYDVLSRTWSLGRDTSVNYIVTAKQL